MLLYCQSKGLEAPVAATLAVTGSLGFYWIQKVFGQARPQQYISPHFSALNQLHFFWAV